MRNACFMAVVLLTGTVGGSEAAATIRRAVLGGGAGGSVGTTHALASTLGQTVAGSTGATVHALRSGFWVPRLVPSDLPGTLLPERFRLHPAVPNPFSGETALHFDVPAPGGRVELRIYDVGGRVVRTLLAGELAPGRQLVSWDGRDDRGRELAFGLYLCTFEAPGYHRAQKLVRIQ